MLTMRLFSPCLLLLALLIPALASPQSSRTVRIADPSTDPSVVHHQESHALLIGVSHYTTGWSMLPSIPQELEEVRRVLERHGFVVEIVLDPPEVELRQKVESFFDRYGYDPDHRLLVFFAGHGFSRQVSGRTHGYLVPVDAPRWDPQRPEAFLGKAVAMTDVMAWARKTEARHALFVFDSCFSGSIFETRGSVPAPRHISELSDRPVRQFLTAGRAGETVPAKSVFTPAFVRALDGAADVIQDGYVTGTELGLYLETQLGGSGQTPQFGELADPGLREGDFVFRLPVEVPPEVEFDVADLAERSTFEEQWLGYQRRMGEAFAQVDHIDQGGGQAATKAAAWQRFLERFAAENPFSNDDEKLRKQAGFRLAFWQVRPPEPPSDRSTSSTKKAGALWIDEVLGMRFRYVPPGSFWMGSPVGEPERDDNEDQHEVRLTRGFWIGETEVTQRQWRQLMGNNPSRFDQCGEDCPVETVNWYEAVAFAVEVSDRSKLPVCYELVRANGKQAGEGLEYQRVTVADPACRGFRLPTEAEWEYAARAGTNTPFWTGDYLTTDQANYDGNDPYNGQARGEYRRSPVAVRLFEPNPWGLYNVHGNVLEWIQDWYGAYKEKLVENPLGPALGEYRVLRGGGWVYSAHYCRSANRYERAPEIRGYNVGFRLVRTDGP